MIYSTKTYEQVVICQLAPWGFQFATARYVSAGCGVISASKKIVGGIIAISWDIGGIWTWDMT